VLANGAEQALDPLLTSILVIAGHGRMPSPSEPPESPSLATDLAAYAGEFAEPNLGEVRTAWQDGALQISVPVLVALDVPYGLALVPAALDVFLWSVAGIPMQMSFHDRLDGEAHAYASGDEIALTRVPVNMNPESGWLPSRSGLRLIHFAACVWPAREC